MFKNMKSLQSLDLSNFDTYYVTYMNEMFENCTSIDTINLSNNFKTVNVVNMSRMFYNCINLKNLDLSSFNITNKTNTKDMFNNTNITIIKGLNFNY